jgi:hypothetical protein
MEAIGVNLVQDSVSGLGHAHTGKNLSEVMPGRYWPVIVPFEVIYV